MQFPIETQHILREEAKARKLFPPNIVASMNMDLVANAIIKDEKADRMLHLWAIVGRLEYCLSA